MPNVNRFHVIDKIKDNIAIEADAVYTDESKLCHRMPDNVQKHEIVNYSAKEWDAATFTPTPLTVTGDC